MIGETIKCHKINSGYKQDYGFVDCKVTQVITLNGIPTIKVLQQGGWNELLAWYKNNERVLDLD